jgi:hypothetical protein
MDAHIKAIITEDKEYQKLNESFKVLTCGIGIIELVEYEEKYGRFATLALLDSRMKQFMRDPMRDAVEELYNDKEFMAGINPEVTKMVHDALYHQQYSA